ncbi:MAG: hypothetical protein IKN67_01240 [Alphaproteobacteria bacterium]|nr:hypothetical protein [Alphaproteobacteria bacterium]
MAKINFKKMFEFVCDVLSFVAALVCVIIAICAMFVADFVALFIYPVYMTLAPRKAAEVDSISGWIGWEWLEDMCELKNNLSWPISWLNMALHFMDAVVIALLSWVTAWTAPMKIRFWFIDAVNLHKPHIQKKFFKMSDEGAQINLLKYGKLDEDVKAELFKDGYSDVFVKAGKITDEQFQQLGISQLIRYAQLHSLSTFKMKQLIFKADDLKVANEVTRIIRKDGLSIEVLNWFHNNVEPTRLCYQTVKSALKEHEQGVTVCTLQTGDSSGETKFVAYLKRNNGLTEYAQCCMSVNQYIIFHREGYKLAQGVVNAILKNVAKGENSPSYPFIAKFVEFGEISDSNEVAHDIIASSEVLTKIVYA